MAEEDPLKRSVPELSRFPAAGIGDGDKNRASGGSTISVCETRHEYGEVSGAGRETVANAEQFSGDKSCKNFWPLSNTDDVMRLLLEDSRHEHEAFTSKLKFLSENSASLNTSEPQPLRRIEFPGTSNSVESWNVGKKQDERICFSSDCHLKRNFIEDDGDFCILLSPRTFCRKLSAEPKSKDGECDDLAPKPKINIPTPWNCKAAVSGKDCEQILESAKEISEAPQLFEIDMNEDKTSQLYSAKQPTVLQTDNPDGQVSVTSSIYHAANTESFMTNAFSSLEASPSSSHASIVSGLDSNSIQFSQELNKCQGMTLTIEYNEEFDGDFDHEDGPLEMDVVWASNRVFTDDDGNRRITIPENDAPDSPAEGDNDLFANFISSQQETGLDQASLERSLSKYLNDQEDQEQDHGNAEITSSLDIGDNALSENDDAISVLSSSSAIDNDSVSDEDGSVYDLDYMGRNDIFWPMMTPSERKMLGAPSTLNVTESEPFEVEETSENVDHEKTSASTDSTAEADDNIQKQADADTLGNQRRHMSCHSSRDGRDNLVPENKADLQQFSTCNVSGSGDDAEVK